MTKYRKWIIPTLAVLMVLAWINVFNPLAAGDAQPPKPDMDKVSYVIGYQIGAQMRSQNVEVKVDNFIEGMRTALAGNESKKTPQEMEEISMQLANFLAHQQRLKDAAEFERITRAFLEQEGARRTESGLVYRIIEPGTGRNPTATDRVTVHYTGRLVSNNQMFDSSRRRGEPATFPLNGVIPGWTEAVQLLKPGGRMEVIIPHHLAYGERGSPPAIPPRAALRFEIELLRIEGNP